MWSDKIHVVTALISLIGSENFFFQNFTIGYTIKGATGCFICVTKNK